MTRVATTLFLLVAFGCGGGASDDPSPDAAAGDSPPTPEIQAEGPGLVGLTGSYWRLEDLAGRGVLDRAETTLEFPEDGMVSGTGGCNRFNGSYQRRGDSLSFGPLAATRMACPEAVMNQESGFFAVLESLGTFEVTENGFLVLQPANGGPPTRLAPTEAPGGEGAG